MKSSETSSATDNMAVLLGEGVGGGEEGGRQLTKAEKRCRKHRCARWCVGVYWIKFASWFVPHVKNHIIDKCWLFFFSFVNIRCVAILLNPCDSWNRDRQLNVTECVGASFALTLCSLRAELPFVQVLASMLGLMSSFVQAFFFFFLVLFVERHVLITILSLMLLR